MEYEIYWGRVGILIGFIALTGLFTWAFFGFGYSNSPTSLEGYVVLEQGVRVSTEKMDSALVQQIRQGESEPHVIIILEESSPTQPNPDALQKTQNIQQTQDAFLNDLSEKVEVTDLSVDSSIPNPTLSNSAASPEDNADPQNTNSQDPDFIVTQKLNEQPILAGEIKSPDALVELTKDIHVARIFLDYPVQLTLDESANRIGARYLWNFSQQNISLGEGLSVCVIDTGVEYTHPALGGCSPTQYSFDGNTINGTPLLESAHPYTNDFDQRFEIHQAGFTNIAVHFSNISLEEVGNGIDSLDRIYVYDQYNQTIAVYKGSTSNVWTPSVEGDTLYIRLVSDSSVTGYGFSIDQVLNGTTTTTMNWNNCSVIKGGWDTFNNDPNPVDDQGHGTHVAGIIASRNETYRGIAPHSSLVSVKALDDHGSGYASDVLAGIEWCTSNTKKYNISAISMSLGCAGQSCVHYQQYCNNDVLAGAINDAVSNNISVFIAAGNNGWTDGISSPSCIESATPIGGVNDNDQLIFNRGNLLSVVAPGTTITSTMIGGGWQSLSGTSMATPHAAAASVLVRDYYQKAYGKNLNSDELETILTSRGKAVSDVASARTYERLDLRNETTPLIEFVSPSPSNGATIYSSSLIINVTSEVLFQTPLLGVLYSNGTAFNVSNSSFEQNATKIDYTFVMNNAVSGLGSNNTSLNGSYQFYGIDSLHVQHLSEVRTFSTDLSSPVAGLLLPLNGSYVKNNFTVQINNSLATILSYSITNSSQSIIVNGSITSLGTELISKNITLSDGNYTFIFNANNTQLQRSIHIENSFIVDGSVPQMIITQSPNPAIRDQNILIQFEINDFLLNQSSIFFETNISGNWSSTFLNNTRQYLFTTAQIGTQDSIYYRLSASDIVHNNFSTGITTLAIPRSAGIILSPLTATKIEYGTSVNYNALTNLTGNTSVLWLFGDGTNSTNLSGIKSYTQEGMFSILFNATNTTNSRSERSTILINDTISPVITSLKVPAQTHLEQEHGIHIDLTGFDLSGISSMVISVDGNPGELTCLSNNSTNTSTTMTCNAVFTSLTPGDHNLTASISDNSKTNHTINSSLSFIVLSCNDGQRNGDESGVDCGVSCTNTCEQLIESQQVSQAQPALTALDIPEPKPVAPVAEAKPVNWTEDVKEKTMSSKELALIIVWGVIAVLSLVYAIFVRRK